MMMVQFEIRIYHLKARSAVVIMIFYTGGIQASYAIMLRLLFKINSKNLFCLLFIYLDNMTAVDPKILFEGKEVIIIFYFCFYDRLFILFIRIHF